MLFETFICVIALLQSKLYWGWGFQNQVSEKFRFSIAFGILFEVGFGMRNNQES